MMEQQKHMIRLADHLVPMNQVLYTVGSIYNQAETLGYNKLHPNEAFWLRERIERNAHRSNYKINLPSPNPVAPDAPKLLMFRQLYNG